MKKVYVFTELIVVIVLMQVLSICKPVKAQGWEKVYRGKNHSEVAYSSVQRPDGNFLIVGDSFNLTNPALSLSIIRLINSKGKTLWIKNVPYCIPGFQKTIINTNDSGYFIVGELSDTFGSETSLVYLKYDRNYQLQWTRNMNEYNINDNIISISEFPDGGYSIIHSFLNPPDYHNTALEFIKMGSSGIVSSVNKYNMRDSAYANFFFVYAVKPFNNTYYLISSGNDASLISRSILWKFDVDGNLIMSRTIISSASAADYVNCFSINNNGIIIAQAGESIYNIDTSGTILKTLDISNFLFSLQGFTLFAGIIQTSAGEYVSTGQFMSYGKNTTVIFLLKLNKNGDSVWIKYFGDNDLNTASDLLELQDGYLITGDRTYGLSSRKIIDAMYIIKTDSNGNVLRNFIKGKVFTDENNNCIIDSAPPPSTFEFLVSAISGDDSIVAAPDRYGYYFMNADSGNYQIIIKRDTNFMQLCPASGTYQVSFNAYNDTSANNNFGVKRNSTISLVQNIQPNYNDSFSIYPNPATHWLTLNFGRNKPVFGTLSIYNLLGEKIVSLDKIPLDSQLDITSLSPGFYSIVINTGNEMLVQKMVKD